MQIKQNIFIYGAPASGKSTLAKQLSCAVGVECFDLDAELEAVLGCSIADYFARHGESAFRAQESGMLRRLVAEHQETCIFALGGGTLLNGANRDFCEKNGVVFCLDTPDEAELRRRLEAGGNSRPLGDQSRSRLEHYASFTRRIATSFDLQGSLVVLGNRIADVFVIPERTVFDSRVAEKYSQLSRGALAVLPSGEQHKTPDSLMALWRVFAGAKLGRKSWVCACGGGVTGDLTGFAAATWMRGMAWRNIPTTLLSMVDASVGGKTGCDLPEGKNLVGAFHSPRLVVIDTEFLQSLPQRELASGKAEMIKHCLIGGLPLPETAIPTAKELARNLAVKVDIVLQDPKETLGKRLLLNCGHTIGHGVEAASNYALSHGEAVAIGCVEEARLAERLGLSPTGWGNEVAAAFEAAGLPVELPAEVNRAKVLQLMRLDKKGQDGMVTFALPCGWGDVRGVKMPLEGIWG